MKRTLQKGFTLIELMIVVAIIGILAAVALPAYQDYTKRAKMTEVTTQMAAARTAVSETFASLSTLTGINNAKAGIEAAASMATPYMKTLTVADGIISVTTQGIDTACDAIASEAVVLVPKLSANGGLEWVGGSNAACTKFVPATFRSTVAEAKSAAASNAPSAGGSGGSDGSDGSDG